MHRFLRRISVLAALVLWGSAALAGQYTLPLFVASTMPGAAQGLLRIVNGSAETGSVEIRAVDDAGVRYGPAAFTLNAGTAVEFDASAAEPGWTTLGRFDLDAGEVTLIVTNRTDGRTVVADAVRWIRHTDD